MLGLFDDNGQNSLTPIMKSVLARFSQGLDKLLVIISFFGNKVTTVQSLYIIYCTL